MAKSTSKPTGFRLVRDVGEAQVIGAMQFGEDGGPPTFVVDVVRHDGSRGELDQRLETVTAVALDTVSIILWPGYGTWSGDKFARLAADIAARLELRVESDNRPADVGSTPGDEVDRVY